MSTMQGEGRERTLVSHAKKASRATRWYKTSKALTAAHHREGGHEVPSTAMFLPFLNESRLNISGQEGKLES